MSCKQGPRHTHEVSGFHLLLPYNPAYLHSHPHLETSPIMELALHFSALPRASLALHSAPASAHPARQWWLPAQEHSPCWSSQQAATDLSCRIKFCVPALSDSEKPLLWGYLPCRSSIEQHTRTLLPTAAKRCICGYLKLLRATATHLAVREPRNESASFDTPLWVQAFLTGFTPGGHKHLNV